MKSLALGQRLLQREVNGADQILPRQQRAAVAAKPERQRPRLARKLDQTREIASDAGTIDQHRPQDRERHAGGAHGVLGRKLGTAVGVGRMRRIALPQDRIG